MAYQRGTIDSYKQWATEVGDDSYTFDNFLPSLKKSVTFTPGNNETRAKNASLPLPSKSSFDSQGGGPVQISYPNWGNAFSSFVIKGLNQLGLKTVTDFVSGSLHGVQYQMMTEDPQYEIRISSESAFLRKALATTKLAVYKNSLAKRVLFEGDDFKKATGVSVCTLNKCYALQAKKEVILSAGSVSIFCNDYLRNRFAMLTWNSFVPRKCSWFQE